MYCEGMGGWVLHTHEYATATRTVGVKRVLVDPKSNAKTRCLADPIWLWVLVFEPPTSSCCFGGNQPYIPQT